MEEMRNLKVSAFIHQNSPIQLRKHCHFHWHSHGQQVQKHSLPRDLTTLMQLYDIFCLALATVHAQQVPIGPGCTFRFNPFKISWVASFHVYPICAWALLMLHGLCMWWRDNHSC